MAEQETTFNPEKIRFLLERGLSSLRHLRHDWTDEIPGKIIHSPGLEFKRSKVRGAWLQTIFLRISSIETVIELPPY